MMKMVRAVPFLVITLAACGSGTNGSIDGSVLPCLFTGPCVASAVQPALTLDSASTLDTDTDPRCSLMAQPDGPVLCVIHVSSFSLTKPGRLTATGSRPLVIASPGNIKIDGVLDVSSRAGGVTGAGASTAPSCPATLPVEGNGGGGGGAGGSFGSTGGAGGAGDTDQLACAGMTCRGGVAAPAFAVSAIFSGCAGQAGGGDTATPGGQGGASGGGIYLLTSGSIEITGTIAAGGAGGRSGPAAGAGGNGGGGGGAGGLIVLHGASINVTSTAIVAANGGGGGEGAVQAPGMIGADGNANASAAPGGTGQQPDGGDGGSGGAGTMTTGSTGMVARGGGGGGGGGAGVIRVVGPLTSMGIVSPPKT